jgi:dTDP-4-dehydrorhamnose reductase
MRILVTGKSGQLGKSIYKVVNTSNNGQNFNDFSFVGREELDLSSQDSINNYFSKNDRFNIIINCAAYTAVDKAEEEQDIANQVNHLAVKQLAEIANKQQAKLIHLSTDYVFDGKSNKPYLETDATNPINFYGKTKLAGEKALQETMPTNAIIIRTSWVYSEFSSNFVKTMIRLGQERDELNVISDQIGSPTYATDLASAIFKIIENKEFKKVGQATQIYHYSNEGGISWYEFAREIFKITKIECKVKPISTEQYPTAAKRPKSVILSIKRIVNTFDINIYNWKTSIRIFFG